MSGALLAWYDRSARVLPWRVPPGSGVRADPYGVWLSEVMLQQTTVAAVVPYFLKFLGRWPTVGALAAAPDAEVMGAWAGLGYYARARNLLACARAVAARGGVFPDSEEALRALPGVGAYTAAAVAAIAFDRPAVVVDGNVERVMARLHAVEAPLPGAKARLKALAAAMTPAVRAGDHAQAVMDLGATICTPKRPACGICPLVRDCLGRQAGIAEELPRRAEKAVKPVRHGIAWLALRPDGAVLVETRPPEGLLGGMLALPSGPWGAVPAGEPPVAGEWRDLGVEVRHTFTHFHLRLRLHGARVRTPVGRGGATGDFRPADAAGRAMPTVMRKALTLGLAALGAG